MLITNFAAGELSENLFGRIDIPQYYQGVSRLENFDVIPTGGIMKRNGTKRILQMDEEGRLIPFILDRENHCLLFLTPGKIRVYFNGVLQSTVVSTDTVPLFATLEEINEVQYAQNFNMMIMVQGNYAPIRVSLDLINKTIDINIFYINSWVFVEGSADIDLSEYNEEDTEFKNKYMNLSQDGYYPRCVSFFQNRVMFAGTKFNPQGIFASNVGDYNKFTTYKKFVTENREYIYVLGSINIADNYVQLQNSDDMRKFIPPFSEYYIDSPYYRETGVLSIEDDKIYLTKPADTPKVTPEQIQQFLTWKQQINQSDVWSMEYTFSREYPLQPIKAQYRVGKYRLTIPNGNTTEYNIIPYVINGDNQKEIKKIIDDPDYLFNIIYNTTGWVNNSPVRSFAEDFRAFCAQTLKYTIIFTDGTQKTYYGMPESIYVLINNEGTAGTENIYIAFYKRKYVIDRYPTPDDGFTFEIASDMSDAIRWIGQNKNLLIGTETAEWIVPAGTNATNVQAILNSRYGSDKIQGTSIGDAMCFFQSGKKSIVEYYIPQQDNSFRANNMAMLSKNMLHESAAFDFDFISAPYTKIFVSREDGIVVCLLYERSTGTFAWGRIITGGEIRSVATLPGESGYDDVYLIVKRDDAYFLELLQYREYVYLDSHQAWTGDAAGYSDQARVFDETDNKIYPITQAPLEGHTMWIGYPFAAIVRSMPILANDRMKPNAIKSLSIRFYDSFMPRMKSIPNNVENTIARQEPYTGIVQVPFPGVYERDVHFELIHDKPTRCQILAVNAEAN